jgi:hypothetical protein
LKDRDVSNSVTRASGKSVLYQEVDGTKYEIDLPLTSLVNIREMMSELGLPSYIDLEYFPMRSAVVTIWASQKADKLRGLYPQAFEKEVCNKPIPALLFGGAAMKVHCEHSNGETALSRVIKDTDFIVPKSHGSNFCKLLLGVDKAFGTQFKFFRTKGDVLFNGLRQGQRYRIRTINGVSKEGFPTVTVLDIFCDFIDLRHKIDVKDSFEHYKENLFTIGLEHLILSKSQFITDFPKAEIQLLKEHGQEFRVLPYDYYSPDKVVLGMEEKDVKDVCAIFLDHPIGDGKEEINPDKVRKALEKDKKLALTVTLNLRNLIQRTELIGNWMKKSEAAVVVDRIRSLLETSPRIDKKWNRPWWNTAVETPMIE